MARYSGAVCRICRREGVKLFLKGIRCMTDKCSFGRRSYIPGQHGKSRPGQPGRPRSKLTEYALQLREKQKVKRIYGILEKQFKNYFRRAARAKGVTGEILLQFLERRLDSIIFNLDLSVSRVQARQIINHGHVFVNGRRVDLPSYLTKPGDVITLKGKESFLNLMSQVRQLCKDRAIPVWLEAAENKLEGKILRLPLRGDIVIPIEESLIVELYSK